jgi:hypothetical protein
LILWAAPGERLIVTSREELTDSQILRRWPYHVTLPAEAVLGTKYSMAMYGLARTLGGAPRPCRLRRDDRDLVVFCFARAESARMFLERFGGELGPRR